jgi:hypothetical protein
MIEISVGRDLAGQFWWVSSDPASLAHGPFRTRSDAYGDAEITLLGAPCKITDCGQLDSAWDRKQ